MPVTLRYFAWVRERVGRADEQVELPTGAATVADLLAWLATRGDGYGVFEKPAALRVAIDQVHVAHTARIAGAREIAIFPPVTGG